MKEIFTGKKRPPKKVKNEEILNELKLNKHAISYSSDKIDIQNTKVIYEIK